MWDLKHNKGNKFILPSFQKRGSEENIALEGPRKRMKSKDRRKIEEMCKEFDLGNDRLHDLAVMIKSEIDGKGNNNSVKCLPTYIPSLPNGKECGRYLSLELTTSSVKVCLIDIKDDSGNNPPSKVPIEVLPKAYKLEGKLKTGKGEKLFDYLAVCLRKFIQEKELEKTQLLLAFTFPFAVDQKSLTRGELLNWSKGFNCSGVIGVDVVVLLKDALQKAELNNVEVNNT